MDKVDGRGLSAEAKEERRRIIIRLKKAGRTDKEIAGIIGCAKITVYKLCKTWKGLKSRKKDEEAVKIKKCGRKTGYGRTLTESQEAAIQKTIIDKYPDQMKFDFALWTREAVQLLIKTKFKIEMPIRTVGEYLKRWGYTVQKPLKYAYERDNEKVQEWLKNTYPAIKRKAKREKGVIYWADETTIRAGEVKGRGYAPKGKTPVVYRTQKHENVSMVSAITNQGKVFWKTHEGSIDSEKFLDFVKQLVKYKRKKIFLIMDNAKPHQSELLTEWVKKRKKRIALFYLPPYSPDLNPDEHTNGDVKYGVGSKRPKKKKAELLTVVENHMMMLGKNPERIRKYFEDPTISYAA